MTKNKKTKKPWLTKDAMAQIYENNLWGGDLGCGDFNIGKEPVKYSGKYIAVGIVPELAVGNKKQD